jgi:16S rRNA (cytosine967-C5)-methyltransferase
MKSRGYNPAANLTHIGSLMQTRPLSTTPPPVDQHALAESFALAGVVIGRVLGGESLTRAMAGIRATGPLRAAVQDLSFSALRDYGCCDSILSGLTTRPPSSSLRGLLLAALVELRDGPQKEHAVVHQAVEAAGRIAPRGGPAAKGLVNAVLRNFLRQRDNLLSAARASQTGQYRHPQWWIDRVRVAWPRYWESILAAGNEKPTMTLRVNARRMDALAYLQKLEASGIRAKVLGTHAVRLERPLAVENLPGFRRGEVSVQDWGAQQASGLLQIDKGMKVLDACAAPGGKTAHIAELHDCDLTAADIDPERLERVRANLRRLGLSAKLQIADAMHMKGSAARFHRILADVPCTASGVVRRHPDIKWLRRDSDVARFAATQRAMLDSLWRLLAPGGLLLYATCSVFPEENHLQVQSFLARQADASQIPLAGLAAAATVGPGQILPSDLSDGFYYALLRKQD